jgi:hypothetical protein
LATLKEGYLFCIYFIQLNPYISISVVLYIILYLAKVNNDIFLDNLLLSSGGNLPPLVPTGGGGNPLPPMHGGGNPLPPMHGGGNPLPPPVGGNLLPPMGGSRNLLNANDVDPIYNSKLQVVYAKLSQLAPVNSNTSPNRGLTMNSNRLQNLVFTHENREFMAQHISTVHPDMAHRFSRSFNHGYSLNGQASREILNLFKLN